jgi:hypothetical protein
MQLEYNHNSLPASQHVSEGYEAIKICEAQRLKTNRVFVIFVMFV